MSIEAMKQALEALNEAVAFREGGRQKAIDAIAALRTAIQQAEAKTDVPVAWPVWCVATGEQVNGVETYTHHDEYVPLADCFALYTHPAPGVPDGLQWFTVDEHGLPEVGETVIGGLWYTDPWLKPDRATYFMWGQCSVIAEKHHDFKEGKRWLTFGPSHNQITHWARLTPPAMLTAASNAKGES